MLKEINELYCDTNGRPYRCLDTYVHIYAYPLSVRHTHNDDTRSLPLPVSSPPTKNSTLQTHQTNSDVRILHTYVLEDPFDDPPSLAELIPDASPERDRPPEEAVKPRLTDLVDEEDGLTAEELEERIREAEAKKRAVVLEMIGCEGGRCRYLCVGV